jgi:hypothetical protein
MNFSTTYVAGIVSVVAFVLPLLGFDVSDTALLNKTVVEIVGAVSAIYIFIGRYKAGGISAFGFKKK